MADELPVVSGKEAIAAFERAGFRVVRTSGSHHIMTKKGHALTLSVPVHRNQPVAKGTLRKLIRSAGMTVQEYKSHMQ